MTDQTFPERIFVWQDNGKWSDNGWDDAEGDSNADYVRADLYSALEERLNSLRYALIDITAMDPESLISLFSEGLLQKTILRMGERARNALREDSITKEQR